MTSNATGPPRSTDTSLRPFATGWTIFAAVLMFFGGVMAVFQGITAIAKDDLLVVTRNYAYTLSLTSWGWIHLILGFLIALTGLGLFSGAMWARVIGIGLTGLGLIANFLWLPYYPVWAVVLIAIDIFIIWALCAGIRKHPEEY
ncbi:DUF7144 family membrane protein [Actinospica robiniae]|uniref:DUF7144 family membrane protein n=1 Tax=Actinospica robiniae TaxID=304901 RepID=UPI000414A211|nr:hypothetical protein [Actinospica robiniae]